MANSSEDGAGPRRRPFIGMHFRCCHVYSRIYLDERAMMFRGRCPRCGAAVEVKAVRSGGSSSTLWSAE